MELSRSRGGGWVASLLVLGAVLSGGAQRILATCGPFTDTAADSFCPFILEVFYLGITTGTTPTTYDPTGAVNRTQMAAFLSRTVDATLKRGSRRAALERRWTPQNSAVVGITTLPTGFNPQYPRFDGADVWVAAAVGVYRVRASDARLLETWTASLANGIDFAMNRVLVTGVTNPGKLYVIDPSQPPSPATLVASNLGADPLGIAFDGARVWTTNALSPGSVSIVTPGAAIPWTVTTLSVGTGSTTPVGVVFDGSSIWVTDFGLGTLLKVDGAGNVLQTVTVGTGPYRLIFDGTNLWVPNSTSNSVTVVRASNGTVLGTLTGNGLNTPLAAAFDGERILVTNVTSDSVSLWKAADLTSMGDFGVGTQPAGACSDGAGFWIALNGSNKLAHF